jgi:hypothetical protein
VVLGAGSPWRVEELVGGGRRVLCEVTSLAEVRTAAAAGAHGLIARGAESGGPVGDLSAFVLLQQLLSQRSLCLPVWLCGGVGEHTAAVVGGAAGVVLDTQLALVPEADLPGAVRVALRAVDGPESVVIDGHRVLRPPRPPAAEPGGGLGPIGQDGFLAARFRDRYGDATGVIRAVLTAVADAVNDEDTPGLLAPRSALASDWGGCGCQWPKVR